MKSFILCRMSVSEHGHFFEWRNTQCKFSSGVAGFLWYQLILKTDKIRKSEAQQHQVYWEKSFFESQCSPGWKSPAGTGPKVMYKPYFSDHLNPSISEQLNVGIISLSPTYQGTSHPPHKKKSPLQFQTCTSDWGLRLTGAWLISHKLQLELLFPNTTENEMSESLTRPHEETSTRPCEETSIWPLGETLTKTDLCEPNQASWRNLKWKRDDWEPAQVSWRNLD